MATAKKSKAKHGKHRFCSKPGQKLLVQETSGGRWVRTPPLKAVCGKVVRVTGVKIGMGGDIRGAQTVVVIKARGRLYGVPAKLSPVK